jgi:hypothetical protein
MSAMDLSTHIAAHPRSLSVLAPAAQITRKKIKEKESIKISDEKASKRTIVKPRQGLGSVSDQFLQLTGLAVHLRRRCGLGQKNQSKQARLSHLQVKQSVRTGWICNSSSWSRGEGSGTVEEVEGYESR